MLLENKTDLRVETRGASMDAENNEICNPNITRIHTNGIQTKRPLQVDVAGASKDAPVNTKI